MKVTEIDIVFLSYDEPNADLHYADLCNKVPWAKRVHGVKGSDHAHKAAANLSETDWFITVDADNIVNPKFSFLYLKIKILKQTKIVKNTNKNGDAKPMLEV